MDAIVTIATKGISLANAVANVLNLPVVVIRKDNKVTEGSTVSINYVSGSSRKIADTPLTCALNSFIKFITPLIEPPALIKSSTTSTLEFSGNVRFDNTIVSILREDVLNLPVVVIRKDNKVTEGSTVSINYVSGSSRKIETMVLSKRTLPENSNVLVVDDFMRAGGSINGVMNLMNEFKAHVKGVSVLVESKEVKQRLIEDYTSLVRLSDVDEYNQEFKVETGNSLTKFS